MEDRVMEDDGEGNEAEEQVEVVLRLVLLQR